MLWRQNTLLSSVQVIQYTVKFNSVESAKVSKKKDASEEGPVIERRCPKCPSERMSYATIQVHLGSSILPNLVYF